MQKVVCYLATFLWLAAAFQGIYGLGFGEDCIPATPPTQDACDPTLNLICDSTEKKCICQSRYWFDDAEKKCKAALKSACRKSFEGCQTIPYALCDGTLTADKCQCMNDYKESEKEAYCEAPKIGDHCLEDGQCSVQNAACSNNECTCVQGYVPDDANKECLKSTDQLGEACTNDAQCAEIDPLSTCEGLPAAGTCECNKAFYVNDPLSKGCLPVARKIGDQCSTLAQCTANFGASATCESGACVCRNNLTPSIDKASCLEKIALEATCVQDQQCSVQVSGSECFELKCKCQKGYEPLTSNGKQICSKVPQIIGDTCTINEQCAKISTDSQCILGTCTCNVGFYPTTDKKKCLKGAEVIGSDCADNVQCSTSIPQSVCDILTKKCACKVNYVSAEDQKSCLEKVDGINAPCTDNGQCTAAVFGEVACLNDKCNCKPECHYLSNTCWKTKRLGDGCEDTKECLLAEYTDRVVCRDRICQCKDGLTEDKVENKCNTGSTIVASGLLWAGLLLMIKNLS